MQSNLYGITEKTMQRRRISYKNLDENEKDNVIFTSLLEESISWDKLSPKN